MKLHFTGLICCLGISLSALPANGAEMIFFELSDTEVKLSRQDFEALAQTGTLPAEIQAMLGPGIQAPKDIQQLLSRPIRFPSAVGKFINSATGEFILRQLDTLISSTSGQEAENFSFLKSAFTRAVQDQQISFLDLVQQYPQKQVRVNLIGLERTYHQVAEFVENIQTESGETQRFLANFLCNCPENITQNFNQPLTRSSPNTPLFPCNASSPSQTERRRTETFNRLEASSHPISISTIKNPEEIEGHHE